MNTIIAIIKSLRPKHWIKNSLVFVALIFAAKFTDVQSVVLAVSTFFLFSFAASSVYLLNDIFDYEADREHPTKKYRPIATGDLSRIVAAIISLFFGIGVLGTSLIISPLLTVVLAIYFINNLLYSFKLKHVAIIDILMVAFGFVLRAVGGAVAIGVSISPWFLVVIFLLMLFLAIMKRRQEFVVVNENGGKKRKVLDSYSIEMLDQMGNIIIPTVLVSYVFYTFNTFHTQYFIFTIPLVIYGVFRYLYLVHKKDFGESPTETLIKDLPLFLTVIFWGIMCVILIYFYK